MQLANPLMHSMIIFALGLLVSFAATPLFIAVSRKFGVIDKPDPRRVNVVPVARMGGPAMYLGFMSCLGVASVWLDNLLPIAAGATIIHITGVVDDVRGLRPLAKLVGQFLAAMLIFKSGTRIVFVNNPFGDYFYFPMWLSFLLTVFWIVGITNTVNLIDGLDGLAAGITCIAALTFFLVAIQKGQPGSALLAAGLVGVTAGFLRWNFFPAKTFMGDSGALFLGFLVSVLAINGAFKITAALTFLLPVLALGVPIFDTSFAIVRRLSKGQPVMSAPDKGHLHHRLLAAGLSHRDSVLMIYIATLALSIIALVIIRAYLLSLYLVFAVAMLVVLLVILGKLKRRRKQPATGISIETVQEETK